MTANANLAINAEYARLIQPFICRHEERYYLTGFYVEPAKAGGAYIVATDGHTMAIFRDSNASVSKPGIIKLSKTTLAACVAPRPKKGNAAETRTLEVVGERASVYRFFDHEKVLGTHLVAAQDEAVIDGTFPDWRRVVPTMPDKFGAPMFDAVYLARFQALASKARTGVSVFAKSEQDPALVLIDGRDDFAGVLMPMRRLHAEFPKWL